MRAACRRKPAEGGFRDDMNVWDQILRRVETKVNRHSFYTWFKPTSFLAEEGSALMVRVPNGLFRDWLTKHYSGVISEAMTEVKKGHLSVNFVAEAAADPSGVALTPEEIAEATALEVLDASPQTVPPALPGAPGPVGLNPRYTFDTFIVGSSNQFANAACRAVAEAPSRSYNPLFIYGGVGLGKTHLMHAIGHYVLRHDRNREADLHFSRTVHERNDQRRPLRSHHRFPRALSHGRCAAGG